MSGYVYAIESGGAVKIGWSANPVSRLIELRRWSPEQHILIGCARGDKRHEAEIHRICKPYQIKGEWFRKEGHVAAFLDLLPKHVPLPAALKQRGRRFVSGSKLKAYIAENSINCADFAQMIGVSNVSLWRYMAGERLPAPRILSKIHKVTKGAVSPNDFLRRAA